MSKNFWAIVIGSVIICTGIIVAGYSIANRISGVPNSIQVTTDNGGGIYPYTEDTYLSESEASAFLKLSNADIQSLLETGVLSRTYTTIQGQRVFSKNALANYLGDRIYNSVH